MGKIRSMPPAEVTNPSPSTHEERHSRSAAMVRDVGASTEQTRLRFEFRDTARFEPQPLPAGSCALEEE